MRRIVLASASPRRKELLKKLRLKFSVVPSKVEEKYDKKLKPFEVAKHLSLIKAQEIAEKCANAVIIAADTIVVYKNMVLGKPKNKKGAVKMLKMLSGKTHTVITGFTIMDSKTGKCLSGAESARITMNKLTDKIIDNYIKTGEPMDKAGAYAIQGFGAVLIKKVNGDFFSVVGLPLYRVNLLLNKFGINTY